MDPQSMDLRSQFVIFGLRVPLFMDLRSQFATIYGSVELSMDHRGSSMLVHSLKKNMCLEKFALKIIICASYCTAAQEHVSQCPFPTRQMKDSTAKVYDANLTCSHFS